MLSLYAKIINCAIKYYMIISNCKYSDIVYKVICECKIALYQVLFILYAKILGCCESNVNRS